MPPSTSTSTKYTLPQDPLFTRLLTLASLLPPTHPAIIDLRLQSQPQTNTPTSYLPSQSHSHSKSQSQGGTSLSLSHLLSDTIHLRNALLKTLPPSTLTSLSNSNSNSNKDKHEDSEVYIHILAPGGYEFTIGILAILALGAAASPLSTAMPVSELRYYARKSRAVAVLTADSESAKGIALADAISTSTSTSTSRSNTAFVNIPILSALSPTRPSITPREITIESRQGYRDPNGPGIVIFTSGTTGPPKAAVLRRASITDGAVSTAEQLGLTWRDRLLHLLPVHHATGIWISFFPFLQAGATIEFRSGGFDAAWTWERFRAGGLTHFSGVPTVYMRLRRYYLEVIAKVGGDGDGRRGYERAVRGFRVMMCGTSALPKPIDDFWTAMQGGRRIVQRYGSTEMGVIFNMPFTDNADVPDGSVGEVSVGVDMKLSTEPGKEGEILARSFNMFSKYLHDPEATKAAFDEDGYFHSGDIARREGKYYFIVGRASVDIIKSGGYKISALDIEREILALPYIAECMVVGVQDEEFGQRVGCVVSTRTDESAMKYLEERDRYGKCLTLDDLRADLRQRLAGYKLPTLLRLIEGELPKSGTSKVVKKILGPKYFPDNYRNDPEVQIWNPEVKSKL